jgi:hypothetical protein
MMDIFYSHHLSLPSMISENDCDTELPHNIYDEEFGPDTKLLPESRPNTEPTPISYMVSKVKLCFHLGVILQATSRVKDQVHYDDILRFDAKLQDIRAELPPHLRMQPLDSSSPLTSVMSRFHLDILYLKIICVLHRKYIPRARHNPRYAHSRRSAIEASLATLRHLATLHRESQPGGLLHSIKWFFTSVTTKDFLLPAMLVVADLHFDNACKGTGGQHDAQSFWTREQRQEMINSLELTRDIWKELADVSIEAYKASNVLEIMLIKIKSLGGADGPKSPSGVSRASGAPGSGDSANRRPGQPEAIGRGINSGAASSGPSSIFNGTQSSMNAAGYGGLNMGLDSAVTGMNTGTGSGTSTGMGSAAALNFANPMLGFDSVQSPLTMFDNMASSTLDFPDNSFDWVSTPSWASVLTHMRF